jgi:hypothetical protein
LNTKKTYRDICLGYSALVIKNTSLFVKHLSPFDSAIIDEIYEEAFLRAKSNGLETRQQKLDIATSKGIWNNIKEKSLLSYQNDIAKLHEAKHSLQNKKHLKSLNEEIELMQNSYNEIAIERFNITRGCAEDFAENTSNQYQIFHSLYTDENLLNKAYSKDDFDYLDSEEYFDILLLCKDNLENFNLNNIKTIACGFFFQDAFSLVEHPKDFFNKPVYNLTYYQIKLLKYGNYFKNIYANYGSPPEDILENPDKIEEWYFIKKSGHENEEKEMKVTEDKWRTLVKEV